MERNEIKSSDHIAYVVASLAILALLAFFASRSVIVIHKMELPILRFQAGLFNYFLSGHDYEIELYRIQNINNVLDEEFTKNNNYSTIKTDILKEAVRTSSTHTRNSTRILVFIFLGSVGLLIVCTVIRARNRLYEKRENIRSFQDKGVEGYIRLVGPHLEAGMIELIKRSPTPDHLGNAFRTAREKVNIPCSVAARLFPRGSRERLVLLEYGKAKVRFAENPEGHCNV
ncbi:MAG: hypothetical protein H6Q52_536 [Deltaproteobacteria bacterium]|nr:hypothetical protein [Deltaproteobacteria bacterium]